MEFKFVTAYNHEAMTAMALALRKTVRKKHSRRSHVLGWIVVVLGLLLSLPFGNEHFEVNLKTVITWLLVVIVFVALMKEDAINGYFAWKRMLPQLKSAETVFTADGYRSVTEAGTSEFHYNNIVSLAETKEYFVFIFSNSHAQVYDKRKLTGGTAEEFRAFIRDVSECTIHKVF